MNSLRIGTLRDEIGQQHAPIQTTGRTIGVRGQIILAQLPQAAIGDLCYITTRNRSLLPAEVCSFEGETICLAPFDHISGIFPGAVVQNTGARLTIPLPTQLLGSVIDAEGKVLHCPQKNSTTTNPIRLPIFNPPPPALSRVPISRPLITGVAAIDAFCTIGCGQRLGLFAGAGLGKSTLLGMIARNTNATVNVIALVGERGREVREFIDQCLGPEGLQRSVVVVATSDEAPAKRRLAAITATAIAEYFRDQGDNVLLLVDSLTRMARAVREMTLDAGQLPVHQGYTASVFTELPQLLERAGTNSSGSITGIYTVLTTGSDESDPLGAEIKSLLDGHIVLDRRMMERGLRPAIDTLQSISRLFNSLHEEPQRQTVQTLLKLQARLSQDRDMILFGGTPDPELQAALEFETELNLFLTQNPHQRRDYQHTLASCRELAAMFTERTLALQHPA